MTAQLSEWPLLSEGTPDQGSLNDCARHTVGERRMSWTAKACSWRVHDLLVSCVAQDARFSACRRCYRSDTCGDGVASRVKNEPNRSSTSVLARHDLARRPIQVHQA